jgi:conjugal transfer mating pair stabilization protein TraG
MAVEIVTSGGGEALYYILNAVAAITGGSSFMSLIKISLSFGTIWITYRAAFSFPFGDSIKWFLAYLVLYNALLLPKETVLITDNFDPAFARTVDNVPIGIAEIGSYTSQIGIGIAELFDQNFGLPDDMQYSKNGFLFGSKLLKDTAKLKITNAEFSANMNDFIIQCVFYDIAFNKYTINDLNATDDLWNFLINEHTQSPLRMFTYANQGNRQYVTCAEGSRLLANQWNHEIDSQMNYLYRRNFDTSTSNIAAVNYISSYLQTADNYLMNSSKSATDVIRQNMMINAMNDASYSYDSSSVSQYSDAVAGIESVGNFQRLAAQAEEWIPLLRTVFEAILYGMFPFLFIMFLLPSGHKVFMGYVSAFLWIESWPPLYAILHLIMTLYNRTRLSFADGAQTLGNISILVDINNTTAILAGAAMMSIPYISLKLLPFAQSGFAGIGYMAGSMLAPASGAAASAAHEASRGNFSAGSSSLDTHSFDTNNAHKSDTSFASQSYGGNLQNSDGSVSKYTGDGKEHIDTTAMQSNFSHDMKTSMSISDALQQRAGTSQTMGHNLEQESSKYEASSIDTAAKMAHMYSQGKESGEGWTKGVDVDTQKAFDQINTIGKKHGWNWGFAADGTVSGSYGSEKTGKLSGSASGKVGWNHESYKEDQKVLKDAMQVINKSSKQGHFNIHDSEGKSLNEELNTSFTKSQQLSDKASSYYNEAKNLSNEATKTKSLEGTVTTNEATGFYDWMRNQGYSRKEVSSIIENPDRSQTFQAFSDKYMQGRVDSIYSADYGKNLMDTKVDNNSYAKQSAEFTQQHAGEVKDQRQMIKDTYDNTRIAQVRKDGLDNSKLIGEVWSDVNGQNREFDKKKEK